RFRHLAPVFAQSQVEISIGLLPAIKLLRVADARDEDESRAPASSPTQTGSIHGSPNGHPFGRVVEGHYGTGDSFDSDDKKHSAHFSYDAEPRIQLWFLRRLVNRRNAPMFRQVNDSGTRTVLCVLVRIGKHVVRSVACGMTASYFAIQIPVDLRKITRLEIEVTEIDGRHPGVLHIGSLRQLLPTVAGRYCVWHAVFRNIIQRRRHRLRFLSYWHEFASLRLTHNTVFAPKVTAASFVGTKVSPGNSPHPKA